MKRGGKSTVMLTGNTARALGKKNYTNVKLEDLSGEELRRLGIVFGIGKETDADKARRKEESAALRKKNRGESKGEGKKEANKRPEKGSHTFHYARKVSRVAEEFHEMERKKRPGPGQIAVGSAGFDDFHDGGIREQFAQALFRGQSPAEAAKTAKEWASLAVEKHNQKRSDYTWKRNKEFGHSKIEHLERMAEQAAKNDRGGVAPTEAMKKQAQADKERDAKWEKDKQDKANAEAERKKNEIRGRDVNKKHPDGSILKTANGREFSRSGGKWYSNDGYNRKQVSAKDIARHINAGAKPTADSAASVQDRKEENEKAARVKEHREKAFSNTGTATKGKPFTVNQADGTSYTNKAERVSKDGGLVLHRGHEKKGWNITHAGSGLYIKTVSSKKKAEAVFKAIDALGGSWNKPASEVVKDKAFHARMKDALSSLGYSGDTTLSYAEKRAPLTGGEWKTINGAHVYIKGDKISEGGGPMEGKSLSSVDSGKSDKERAAISRKTAKDNFKSLFNQYSKGKKPPKRSKAPSTTDSVSVKVRKPANKQELSILKDKADNANREAAEVKKHGGRLVDAGYEPKKRDDSWGSKIEEKAHRYAAGFKKYMEKDGFKLSKADLSQAIRTQMRVGKATADKVADSFETSRPTPKRSKPKSTRDSASVQVKKPAAKPYVPGKQAMDNRNFAKIKADLAKKGIKPREGAKGDDKPRDFDKIIAKHKKVKDSVENPKPSGGNKLPPREQARLENKGARKNSRRDKIQAQLKAERLEREAKGKQPTPTTKPSPRKPGGFGKSARAIADNRGSKGLPDISGNKPRTKAQLTPKFKKTAKAFLRRKAARMAEDKKQPEKRPAKKPASMFKKTAKALAVQKARRLEAQGK